MSPRSDAEKVLNAFIKKWLLIGAKSLLFILFSGLITFFATLNTTVHNLKADSKVTNVKIKKLEDDSKIAKKQLDDLHWYLIRANKVKVPQIKPKTK